MKYTILLVSLMISGCASKDYSVYVEAQKAISRDITVTETTRMLAISEMLKSPDPSVRQNGTLLLQQLQQSRQPVVIELPKNIFGF
jgi:hypothetical protein